MTKETRYLCVCRLLEAISERNYSAGYMGGIENDIADWVAGRGGGISESERAAFTELVSGEFDMAEYKSWMLATDWGAKPWLTRSSPQ